MYGGAYVMEACTVGIADTPETQPETQCKVSEVSGSAAVI